MNKTIFTLVCFFVWLMLVSNGCFQTSVDGTNTTNQSHPRTYTIIVPGTTNKWTNIEDWNTSGYGTELDFTDVNGKRIRVNGFLIIEE